MKLRARLWPTLLTLVLLASSLFVAPSASALPDDIQRAIAVSQAVEALESYGRANLTYNVSGGGGGGGGQGWYQYTDNAAYGMSIAQVLVSEDHLPADYLTDPFDLNRDHHLRVGHDFLVYRCRDRVAVFAQPSVDGFGPSADDQLWWTENECIRYPIDTLGHSYFEISEPLNNDALRAGAVTQAVLGLEEYARNYGTFTVAGSGGGAGQGWYQYTDDASYQVSIAQALVAEGHLRADYLTDPLDPDRDHHLRVGHDFLVYQCKDRVAVFSQSDGGVETRAFDQTWWSDNGCIDYPITTFGFTYFEISRSLDELLVCRGLTPTVILALGQVPTDGDDVILGTPARDVIDAGAGDDVICARGGDDYVDAGPGNDTIVLGSGSDELNAGAGNDIAYEANQFGAIEDSFDGGGSLTEYGDKIVPLFHEPFLRPGEPEPCDLVSVDGLVAGACALPGVARFM